MTLSLTHENVEQGYMMNPEFWGWSAASTPTPYIWGWADVAGAILPRIFSNRYKTVRGK